MTYWIAFRRKVLHTLMEQVATFRTRAALEYELGQTYKHVLQVLRQVPLGDWLLSCILDVS